MKLTAQTILRIGLGVTFIWIGIMIWQDPLGWGGFIKPWALSLMVGSLEQTMKVTAVGDIVIGLWLLVGWKTWLPSALALLHLLVVVITSGINSFTVRDIGLMGAALALVITTWPVDRTWLGKRKGTA